MATNIPRDIIDGVFSEVIMRGWTGRGEVPHADHRPDHDAERGFLGWLQAEWPVASGADRAAQDRSLHPDANREHDAARQADLSPDDRGIDR